MMLRALLLFHQLNFISSIFNANEPNADAIAIGGLSKQKVTVGNRGRYAFRNSASSLDSQHALYFLLPQLVGSSIVLAKRKGPAGTIEKK